MHEDQFGTAYLGDVFQLVEDVLLRLDMLSIGEIDILRQAVVLDCLQVQQDDAGC